MKFGFTRALALIFAGAGLVVPCAAQSNSAQTPQSNSTQQPASSTSGGKVVFSRSTDDNGQVTTHIGPGATQPTIEMASGPSVVDADRLAVTVTALDLDVRLQTAEHHIAVRALVTVRNDSKAPLAHIPLQISSSLNWEQIRVGGHSVSFPVATLNSDTDHTGQLHEAAVLLPQPLAPGSSLQLDVAYSGTVTSSAQRLVTLGTPEAIALHSDWDEISPDFTGLRGFGNVVWYPVSSVPVILGDGARLFDEIGRQKLSLVGAHFSLRLTVEFPHGNPPTVALMNGLPMALHVADAHGLDADLAGIATAEVTNTTLSFEAPSLFVAVRKANARANVTLWTQPDNNAAYQDWTEAAADVTPFLQSWLGAHPRAQLTILDLPDPGDAPFETGAMLAASVQVAPADKLDGALVHALTHAYTQEPAQAVPAWLNEGLATFMESLWVEKRNGRDQALEMLEADRAALAIAEPSSPGESAGTPLALATEPVYYRTKAAYVLWMLRDLTSDQALSSALKLLYSPPPVEPGAAKSLSGNALYDDLKLAGVRRDLSWFFADWVSADKGLPDLSIESVFPTPAAGGTYLVAVNVANAGYADTEVPVTVRTANNVETERVFVPARGKAVQRILVNGPPTQVQLNDGTVPEIQASVHITNLDQPSPAQAQTAAPTGSQPPPQ